MNKKERNEKEKKKERKEGMKEGRKKERKKERRKICSFSNMSIRNFVRVYRQL